MSVIKSEETSESKWLPRRNVRTHLRIIGFSYAFIGTILLLIAAGTIFFLESKTEAWFRSPGDLLIIFGTYIAVGLALNAIFIMVAGIQLTKLKQWAPPAIMVLTCFSVVFIPIGPLWFVYCFWVLNHKNTELVFGEQRF